MSQCSIHGLANDEHGICPKCHTDPKIKIVACDRCKNPYPEHVNWPSGEGLCPRCVVETTEAVCATSRTLYGSPVPTTAGAPAAGQTCLDQLRRIQLPGWPEVWRRANGIPVESWAWGVAEAERREGEIRRLAFRVLYPVRSYCLGLASVREGTFQLLYWLFPCLSPETQDQAVSGLSIAGELGGAPNTSLRVTIDALAESELSPQNRREIREATEDR